MFALSHIHDISLIKSDPRSYELQATTFRIEAYDVATCLVKMWLE